MLIDNAVFPTAFPNLCSYRTINAGNTRLLSPISSFSCSSYYPCTMDSIVLYDLIDRSDKNTDLKIIKIFFSIKCSICPQIFTQKLSAAEMYEFAFAEREFLSRNSSFGWNSSIVCVKLSKLLSYSPSAIPFVYPAMQTLNNCTTKHFVGACVISFTKASDHCVFLIKYTTECLYLIDIMPYSVYLWYSNCHHVSNSSLNFH